VDRDGIPPSDNDGDDVARLIALTERQHELWGLLREAQNEALRNQLFDELTSNREELARLKDTVSARVDPPPAAKPAPPVVADAESPRSVGEELRSKILTPADEVAPAKPPPPPPPTSPPPRVEVPLQDRAVPITARMPEPEQEPEPEPAALAPEKTPFSSREADLAATRARRETGRPRPDLEVEDKSATDPEPEPPPPVAPPPPAASTPPQNPSRSEISRQLADERIEAAHATYRDLQRVRPQPTRSFSLVAILIAVVAVAAVAWFTFFRSDGSAVVSDPEAVTTTTGADVAPADSPVGQIRAVLDGLGMAGVAVEDRSGTIFLSGVVDSESDRTAAIGATEALAPGPVDGTGLTIGVTDSEIRATVLQAIADAGYDKINVAVAAGVATLTGVTPEDGSSGLVAAVSAVPAIDQVVDMTEAVDRALALDTELQRVIAVTPIVFASGQTDLNVLQERVLDSVAEIIQAYDGPVVTIVGYTDASGSAEENIQISLIRTESVRDYLIEQGVSTDRLLLDARGEESSSGSSAVAGLERRVEFEVGYSVAAGAADGDFRIGIVAPSAQDDYAFTQSIVDAVATISAEFDGVAVDITDNTFVTDEAAATIRSYAAGGYDLVIAHGSQYGTSLAEIAGEFPETAFAWGTAADTFGLPNVSSYEVASDQGGYVMGVVSALITDSDVIGVVGPLEVGDAELFVNGFRNGVLATNAGATVPILYTGSFSDVALAAEAATAHIDAGADILTGTAQMVVGAIGVAGENDALWFGTQSNQTELAPDLVVASQVYRWEVVLRQIVSGIQQGTLGGQAYTINLENGGIAIEYNPAVPLTTSVRNAADDAIAGIISGSISTGS
jgi:basic membrane protein A